MALNGYCWPHPLPWVLCVLNPEHRWHPSYSRGGGLAVGCSLLCPPFALPHFVPSELPAVLPTGRCEPCPDRPIQCLCFSSVLLCVLRRGRTSGLLAAPSRTCTPVRTRTPAHVRLLCCWLQDRPLWLELCCVCRGLLQDPESVLTDKAIIVTREGKLLSRKNY